MAGSSSTPNEREDRQVSEQEQASSRNLISSEIRYTGKDFFNGVRRLRLMERSLESFPGSLKLTQSDSSIVRKEITHQEKSSSKIV
jgi:hypothetical protein